MTMNAYTVEFFAQCPNNGLRIKYSLRVETSDVIPVEQIIAAVESVGEGYHEELADEMLGRFGGLQTMIADHHGVTIETTREAAEPSNVEAKRGGTQ